MSKPILIIHPKDQTTRFLNRIKTHLLSRFAHLIHHFNIQFSDKSHKDCLEAIQQLPKGGTIIFLGHGTSNSLNGSEAPDYDNDFISRDARHNNPELYYGKEIFINENNIEVFKGKKVFCLACNSNEKIAKEAIKKGAITFLGFGDIPSSDEELKKQGESKEGISLPRITKEIKTEINYIIKRSLELAITNSLTFDQLRNTIRFIANQRISDILVNRKYLKERKIVADYIYLIKNEIKVFGDSSQKLV